MRLAHVMSATRIVSPKPGVQHLRDSCTQLEKCRRILKHVATVVATIKMLRPICMICMYVCIYTLRFCRMRYAYAMPTTRIVSCRVN